MISPSEYDRLCDQLTVLYNDLENSIISDITRRLLKTGRITESAEWQIKQLQESGMLYDDILAEIAKRTDATSQHVKALFEDAGVQSIRNDNRYYRAAGLAGIVKMSDAALQTLNAGYLKCGGDLKNLTMTTAVTSQTAYINACNQAYMQVTSGAFDYNTAIRNAIKSVAVEGTHVLYPTGHRDRIDVAVRRAVLTGVGQTVRKLSVINAEDMGCDIMEITAHSGARPSHAVWQGKLVSLSGKNAGKIIEGCRVLSLSEIGYGSGDGFGGWNCRHDWYPFFEGISHRAYSDERLKELDAKNIEYNGKKYSEYEISQIQRRYEREIRAAKREQTAFKTAVEETKDPELKQVMQDSLNYANDVVKQKQAKMRDFIKQTGQFRDYSREQNYGRVAYSKNSEKTLTSVSNSGKIESGKNYGERRKQIDIPYDNEVNESDLPEFNKKALQSIIEETGYSEEEAKKFHGALIEWFGGDYEEFTAGNRKEQEKIINNGLARMGAYDGTIGRGMVFSDKSEYDKIACLKIGEIVPGKSVYAWSSEMDIAKNYSAIEYKNKDSVLLVCNDNKTGVGMQHISKYGKTEAEILAPSTTKYEIIDKHVINKYDYFVQNENSSDLSLQKKQKYLESLFRQKDEISKYSITIFKVKEV